MTFAPAIRVLHKNTPAHMYPKPRVTEGGLTFMHSLGTPKESIQWAFNEMKHWTRMGREVKGFTVSANMAIQMGNWFLDRPNYLYGQPADVVDDGYETNWIKIHVEGLPTFDEEKEL